MNNDQTICVRSLTGPGNWLSFGIARNSVLRAGLFVLLLVGVGGGTATSADRPIPPVKPVPPSLSKVIGKQPAKISRPVPPTKPKVARRTADVPASVGKPAIPSAPEGGPNVPEGGLVANPETAKPVRPQQKPNSSDANTSLSLSKKKQKPGIVSASVVAIAQDPISEAIGCRIGEPYSVEALGEKQITLKPSALIDASLIPLLLEWIDKDVQPLAMQHLGSPIAVLQTSSSYVCRTRNNKPGAKLSEHALGNALDISGFRLTGGDVVSVDAGWQGGEPASLFLKAVHNAACKHFTTVLGPDADEYHKTHFHLDRGRHGKSGTYRICQ